MRFPRMRLKVSFHQLYGTAVFHVQWDNSPRVSRELYGRSRAISEGSEVSREGDARLLLSCINRRRCARTDLLSRTSFCSAKTQPLLPTRESESACRLGP